MRIVYFEPTQLYYASLWVEAVGPARTACDHSVCGRCVTISLLPNVTKLNHKLSLISLNLKVQNS